MQHHPATTTNSTDTKPNEEHNSPLEVQYIEEEEDARRRRMENENRNQSLDEIIQVDVLMPAAAAEPAEGAGGSSGAAANASDKSSDGLPIPPNGSSYALDENLIPQHAIAVAAIGAAAAAAGGAGPSTSGAVAGAGAEATIPHSHSDLLRSRIRAIAKDNTLSSAERDRERQKLFTVGHSYTRGRERAAYQALCKRRKHVPTLSQHSALAALTAGAGASTTGGVRRKQRLPGCVHYARGNKIRAPCCGMWAVCRRCHDRPCITVDHSIDRFKISRVLCMRCGTEQGVRKRCVNASCGTRFARYFCAKCKFWDNTPGKDIYHCDKCGLCRVGKGLGHDNYHCDKCNACISIDRDKDGTHLCKESSLDTDCPICGTHMSTSTTQVVFMKCGHAMHLTCFDKYTATNYVCPICNKALTDMSPHYRQIDQVVQAQKLPKEFAERTVVVRCHDCDIRCITNFHFIYLKCVKCNGYNTRLINDCKSNEQVRVLEADNNG